VRGGIAISESVASSCQIFLNPIQRERGHCEALNQAKIVTIKRRRNFRIFSAHITTNVIEIEFSAPLGRQGGDFQESGTEPPWCSSR
jgi:hypothetical protein